jgi:hypothetical protein
LALVLGTLVIAAPMWQLERGVLALGLDDVIPGAEPPLGRKARILLAALAAVGAALAILVPYILLRLVRPRKHARPFQPMPTAKPRAPQSAPDESAGPSRRPIFADRELGAPLMSDAALNRASVFDTPAHEPAVTAQQAPFAEPASEWSVPAAQSAEPMPQPPTPTTQTPDAAAPFVPVTSIWDDAPTAAAPTRAPVAVEPVAPSVPNMSDDAAMTLPLTELIARLERGLASRSPTTPPPLPPVAQTPMVGRADPTPFAPPLSVVPRRAPVDDAERGLSDDLLSQAMSKLSVLVGNQR